MLVMAYIAMAVLGCAYVLGSMLLGHLFDHGASDGAHAGGGEHTTAESYGVDHGGHATASAGDAGGGEFHFPFFSPLALATLMGSLGALGLAAHYGLGLTGNASLLVAVPGALVLTYAVSYAAWKLVAGASVTSTIQAADLEGVLGEVLTPIPKDGVGEVAALVQGQRFTAPARELDGRELPRGAHVRVVRYVGATLTVKAAEAGK